MPEQPIHPLRSQFSHYLLPLGVLAIVTLLQFLSSGPSEGAAGLLRYERSQILGGQWWRLISAHWVHLSWSHCLMNMAGLVVIWLLFHRQLHNRYWLAIIVISGLCISLGFLLFKPQLSWYVGLSGSLHTIFLLGALLELRHKRLDTWLLLLAMVAKLIYEQALGPLPGSEASAGGNVVVDAHFYGAITGFWLYVIILLLEKYRLLALRPSTAPVSDDTEPDRRH